MNKEDVQQVLALLKAKAKAKDAFTQHKLDAFLQELRKEETDSNEKDD